jgi:ATP/maltotriose-dependent transcriptional regulator MalT
MLLAWCARSSQRWAAWLSLDPGDNDTSRFWRHAAAALDHMHPGRGDGWAAARPPRRRRSKAL